MQAERPVPRRRAGVAFLVAAVVAAVTLVAAEVPVVAAQRLRMA